MNSLKVDNYIIKASVFDILTTLKAMLTNGKLKEIQDKSDDIVISCPFHDNGQEEHGSCFVRKSDGVFHCFGCDERGPILKLIATCLDSSTASAKAWLLKTFKAELVESQVFLDTPICINNTKHVRAIKSYDLSGYESWNAYLNKRKLSRATCDKFNVKFDPKTQQIIFPVYDEKENIVLLAKRSIKEKKFFLEMPKNVLKPVYCLNEINKLGIKSAVITEGPFDCLTGWEYGYPTIATLGEISDYQIEQINKSCLNVLYIAFDNDAAGKHFAEMLKSKLSLRIIPVDIKFPNGKKDLNDLTKKEFEKLLQNVV